MPNKKIETDEFSVQRAYLYFWLPSDKDIFGFQEWDEALLNVSSEIKTEIERPLAQRIPRAIENLQTDRMSKEIGNVSFNGDDLKAIELGELSLRKIQSGFTYHMRGSMNLKLFSGISQLHGIFTVYSNGLYVWQFDNIPFSEELSEDEAKGDVRDFLIKYFVANHVSELFGFGWNKHTATKNVENDEAKTFTNLLAEYKGILNYYQMDLLFNGLFDEGVIPHHYFSPHLPDPSIKRFGMTNIIKSIALFSWDGIYEPLGIQRKTYTYRENHHKGAHTQPRIVPQNLLNDHKDNNGELNAKDVFVSRLTYSAIEQFVRVTNTFSLMQYSDGISFSMKRLSEHASVSILQKFRQITPQSLADLKSTLIQLERYHLLLTGKISLLKHLQELIADLADISVPFSIDLSKLSELIVERKSIAEWAYSRRSLNEAIKQQKQKISLIEDGLARIASTLAIERERIIMYELAEIRKISEIDSENQQSQTIKVEPIELGTAGIERFVSILAILIAIISILIDIAIVLFATWIAPAIEEKWQVFVAENSFIKDIQGGILIVSYVCIVIAVLLIFRSLSRRSILTRIVETFIPPNELQGDEAQQNDGNVVISYQIFDNSSLRQKIRATNYSELAREILSWRNEMPLISNPSNMAKHLSCQKFNILSEKMTSTTKYKFSLETTTESDTGLSYTMHLEIDEDIISKELEITDVRVVIKCPQSAIDDYRSEAQEITKLLINQKLLNDPEGSWETL